MSTNELNVELREGTGKGICRRLRSAGMVPGIIYGKGFNPTAVSINLRELSKTIETAGGESSLITLAGEASLKGAVVIISDMLLDPIKGTPRHVDLHKLNMDEKVRVEVKVKLVGTAKGVK